MYNPKQPECSVSLEVIETAFQDINRASLELTQLLSEFSNAHELNKALEAMSRASLLIGYMISVRNQLVIYKKSGISANAVAKDYLSELKIQMDGLKTILYAYGVICTSLREKQNLDNELI